MAKGWKLSEETVRARAIAKAALGEKQDGRKNNGQNRRRLTPSDLDDRDHIMSRLDQLFRFALHTEADKLKLAGLLQQCVHQLTGKLNLPTVNPSFESDNSIIQEKLLEVVRSYAPVNHRDKAPIARFAAYLEASKEGADVGNRVLSATGDVAVDAIDQTVGTVDA